MKQRKCRIDWCENMTKEWLSCDEHHAVWQSIRDTRGFDDANAWARELSATGPQPQPDRGLAYPPPDFSKWTTPDKASRIVGIDLSQGRDHTTRVYGSWQNGKLTIDRMEDIDPPALTFHGVEYDASGRPRQASTQPPAAPPIQDPVNKQRETLTYPEIRERVGWVRDEMLSQLPRLKGHLQKLENALPASQDVNVDVVRYCLTAIEEEIRDLDERHTELVNACRRWQP